MYWLDKILKISTGGKVKVESVRKHFSLGHGLFFALGFGFALVFLSHEFSIQGKSHSSELHKPLKAAGAQALPPWGKVEIVPIILERPEEFFVKDETPAHEISWFFPGYGSNELTALFSNAGLTAGQENYLKDTNHWRLGAKGIWVNPGMEIVRELAPDAREKIYRVLAASEENLTQKHPWTFDDESFAGWFADSDLSAETVDAVTQMTYRRNGRINFSDSQYFRMILAPNEVLSLAKTLARVPTLIMNLKVEDKSEIPALCDYWGLGSNHRSLNLFLHSLARVTNGASMSVTYFFPPLPHSLVYTYPSPTNLPTIKPPDCFWTSMNFFSDTIDNRFFNGSNVVETLKRDYQVIPKPERFGDLMFYYYQFENSWEAVHMCVYVADDVVFTKNGAHIYQPWVLMRLPDMLRQYPNDRPMNLMVCRRNKAPMASLSN